MFPTHDAVEGRDDELDRCTTAGGSGRSAPPQRFQFVNDYDLGEPSPHRYLAVYEITERREAPAT